MGRGSDAESWILVGGLGRMARRRSASEPVPPPAMGAAEKGYVPIADAPGAYVYQR